MLAAIAPPARAQLEVLLRGVQPAPPKAGACGVYRFVAREPDGERRLDFHACVEAVPPRGPVVLRLWSGDSLEARIEVAPALFEAAGGGLAQHVLRVVQKERGTTREMTAAEWQDLPALAPAPRLPVLADSSLGSVLHAMTQLDCQGRVLIEAKESKRRMGDADVVQREWRRLEVLTNGAAPILGVVRARATVRSERSFSQPIPGVPERGPRQSHYELELLALEILPSRP